MRPLDPELPDDVAALVLDVVGPRAAVSRLELLQTRLDAVVVLVTITGGRRLLVKLSGPQAEYPVSYERTAAITRLARSAGVPVPEILAADDSRRRGRWRYLVAQYVDGVPWRSLHSQLEHDQVAAVHRQLATALLTVQSVRFPAFGELDGAGQPARQRDLLDALHHRAYLRVRDRSARTEFHELLERKAHLFTAERAATLCHDDLHSGNVLFRRGGEGWRLAALLDWDKAWAGPAESDVARLAFWDHMTGPGFWDVYNAGGPRSQKAAERALIYQLLWCLEYDDSSPRHAADTARLRRLLAVG